MIDNKIFNYIFFIWIDLLTMFTKGNCAIYIDKNLKMKQYCIIYSVNRTKNSEINTSKSLWNVLWANLTFTGKSKQKTSRFFLPLIYWNISFDHFDLSNKKWHILKFPTLQPHSFFHQINFQPSEGKYFSFFCWMSNSKLS